MREGAEVIVNGEFERIIHFNEANEIVLSNWSEEDFIFSIRKKSSDDRYNPSGKALWLSLLACT